MVYRPPNFNADNFIETISNIITTISSTRTPVYIMEDFNINILNHDGKDTQNLVNMFYSFSFFPPSNQLVSPKLQCLLLIIIWTNNFDNYIMIGIICHSISDHFPAFSKFSTDNNHDTPNSVTIRNREFINENINAFKIDLSELNWSTNGSHYSVN